MSDAGIEVIVIGGSAGALEALLAIAGALPQGFAIPIVVVLHLSPTATSLVPTLLSRVTSLACVEVESNHALASGTILVAPPGYHVLLERDRTVSLSVDAPVKFSRPSIDVLFESATHAFGAGVVAVVLSGANDDGSDGLAAVVGGGGRGLVQANAPYPTMPEAARARVATARMMDVEAIARTLATVERKAT